jgi:hypothetical protein
VRIGRSAGRSTKEFHAIQFQASEFNASEEIV